MFGLFPFAGKQHVGLRNGVGLRVDLLPEKVNGNPLARFRGKLVQAVLRNRQHTACATRAIIAGVRGILNLFRDRHEDQVGHKFNGVTRREMLSCLLVVFFVESPDQLLEDHAHGVVVQTGNSDAAVIEQNRLRTEVDGWRNELLNDCAEDVSVDHGPDLIPEFELVQNFLNIRRKTVEVGFEVDLELLRF